MPTTQFTVHTRLSPKEVMAVLTDFGPKRAEVWPNINEAHFKVHEVGADWAEVTEGTAMGWERERYSWDAAAGTRPSRPSTRTSGDLGAAGATSSRRQPTAPTCT